MQEKTDSNWPRFVRTPEAARLLDLSPRTLEKHRCDGTGPIYHKLGGRVVYAVSDLHAWIDSSARQSTSEVASSVRMPHVPVAGRAIGMTR
jgi:predicted DNA-binding transcriptional regulator AlpA